MAMGVDLKNVAEGPTSGEEGTSLAEKESSQAVQVALNIRPLIALERAQGCKDCITVVPGEPQVRIGTHSFTFDHVFGSSGLSLSGLYEKCVKSLVDGLFHGYNATVLAYGQTGSGKTYTMGTAYTVGGNIDGVIPHAMQHIFKQIETLKIKTDFQIRVSYIEILKEEVHDLLDPNPPATEANFGGGSKPITVGKPPIQIRETTNGGITLAGVTETDVKSLEEMAACLEQGSLCRATASTSMNSQSSRSHAIFTITLEQRRKWEMLPDGNNALLEDCNEDYLCAKLHLVDLAGSERAKRTGADGLRFKEGVQINKGLLALGNVISALGDDKKRKEGGHVPYRDSKLTRLLQESGCVDSLGGNSSTVMIACVSPADSNAEENLNTLKYANRARNIQNKPMVNRDPLSAEMQRLRQQLELARVELLCARAGGLSSNDVQIFKQKIAWLESSNVDLRRELHEAQEKITSLSRAASDSRHERDKLLIKLDLLRSGKVFENENTTQTEDLLKDYANRIEELESEVQQLHHAKSSSGIATTPPYSDVFNVVKGSASKASPRVPEVNGDILSPGEGSGEVEADVVAKELEYTSVQADLDKELQELNECLEQKEAEMKSFIRIDTLVLKQHFEKKLIELEEEKRLLQKERDKLMMELETLSHVSDESAQKHQDAYTQKLNELETQIADLRKKQENQTQLLRQKQRSDEAAKGLQDEIVRMKTQKVQIQQKMKQESEQFRLWRASREKEVLQLKKEGRRNIYELHKIQALHLRQKMVLQRKTEEAATAMRRLKELQEARKSSKDTMPNGTSLLAGPSAQSNEKLLQHWLEQELEMALRVHEVRSSAEKQKEERAATAKELMELRLQADSKLAFASDLDEGSNARHARIAYLESLLSSSSGDMVAMASQLSEAEERERACSGRARWQHLRSMGDAKILLHLMFDVTSYSRCRFKDLEDENKELKEKLAEVEGLLKHAEVQRQEFERQNLLANQALSKALVAASKSGIEIENNDIGSEGSRKTDVTFDIRKVSRVPSTVRHSLLESDMDLSDSESEFEICTSFSDTESDFGENDKSYERLVARKAQSGTRALLGRRKHPSVSRKSSTDSQHPLHSSELGSAENDRLNGSGCAVFSEIKESKFDHCCYCSPWSGCKTKKCECKAAGGFCGPECRCKIGRCANRWEIAAVGAPLLSANPLAPVQAEMTAAMGGLRVDETPQQRCILSGDLKTEREQPGSPSSEIEQALVRKGVPLLDSAWKNSLHSSPLSPEEQQYSEATVSLGTRNKRKKDEVGTKRPRRPLSDIGNNKILSKPRIDRPLLKSRRTVPRGLIHLVSVPSPAPQQSAAIADATTPPTTPALVTGAAALAANSTAFVFRSTMRSVRGRLSAPENFVPSLKTKAVDSINSAVLGPREHVVPPGVHPSLPRTGHSPLRVRSDSTWKNVEVDESTPKSRRREFSSGHRREGAAGDKENFRMNSRRL
uniref:Kinesin motor domain-containing protein n=1 Tax=Physcomitrium patens TaxID=3218 RepID=A0A2K1JV77_PHYPA|nr:hypothetical protein PHYPA_015191 [Physcomitrium patens]